MKYIWLSTLIFFSIFVPALAVQSATTIHKGAVQAIASDTTAQKGLQSWADQREELSSKIRDMKMMHSWLEFQNTKHQRYLEKQIAFNALKKQYNTLLDRGKQLEEELEAQAHELKTV